MTEKIFLEELTQYKVNIAKRKYITIDGAEYSVGEPFRCSYENSTVGRSLLIENVPDPYYSAIMLIWGDMPTVDPEQ